jgi:phosphatidate cytidylyltransferase
LKDADVTTAGESHKPRIEFNLDWILRPVFGILLAAVSIGSTIAGGAWFALFLALMVVAAAREYHRMVARHGYLTAFGLTSLTSTVMLFIPFLVAEPFAPWLVLAAGAVFALALALIIDERPLWEGFGPLYLCIPAFSAMLIRAEPHGIWILVGAFLAIWATDTGALIAGNLIGGRKLAPVISPNKTWSGTLGGVVAAAAIEAILMAFIGGDIVLGALYGAGIAVVAHAGDLFESWMKRKFQRKDSGSLIPGHGGMLDRIDSALSAIPAVAALVFVFHVNPLFGAHP